jgi:hypothetical protein
VLGTTRFVDACLARVDDPILRSLPLVGGIDQMSDSTDVANPEGAQAARAFFHRAIRSPGGADPQ